MIETHHKPFHISHMKPVTTPLSSWTSKESANSIQVHTFFDVADPVIHTNAWDVDPEGMSGNMGPLGIQMFFETHKCNSICRYLRLPPTNPKKASEDVGTQAASPMKAKLTAKSVNMDAGVEPEV